MRILIMGLPGSGKTTLAKALAEKLGSALWLNADKIREIHKDWDFSYAGRLRQATRMKRYADISEDEYVIADFVCPLPEMRSIYEPHLVVWVDTIKAGRFEDTNKAFIAPQKYDIRVTTQDAANWSGEIYAAIRQLERAGAPSLEH